MTRGKQIVERRKKKRFQAPKGLFAVLRPGYTKMGSVVDVSTGGLAFRYVDREKTPNGTYIDIFMIGEFFHLSKVPVKTITDFEVVNGRPYCSFTIRRCGVQFGELTDHQKAQVEQFIQERTIGEA
jgi:hypothetical protein